MAQRYAIVSLAEAREYLQHDRLGPRLREATSLVNAVQNRSLDEIFGSPDDMKFHSCMTLFAEAEPNDPAFERALDKYLGSQPDRLTLGKLAELKA